MFKLLPLLSSFFIIQITNQERLDRLSKPILVSHEYIAGNNPFLKEQSFLMVRIFNSTRKTEEFKVLEILIFNQSSVFSLLMSSIASRSSSVSSSQGKPHSHQATKIPSELQGIQKASLVERQTLVIIAA